MTARPELPPGMTIHPRTKPFYLPQSMYGDGPRWVVRSAAGEILVPSAKTYAEAVVQAWALYDKRLDPWVAYADALEVENDDLRKRAEAGDEARRVLDLLRGCYGARLLGPTDHFEDSEHTVDGRWRFEFREFGRRSACGDTPEAAILAALERKP